MGYHLHLSERAGVRRVPTALWTAPALAQAILVTQGVFGLRSPYEGPNSLIRARSRRRSTRRFTSGPALGRCRALGKSGSGSGFRPVQHAGRGRLPERKAASRVSRLPDAERGTGDPKK